ncbi:MAG: isoamylase early set domain-containing protein [Verrucomicrobia bacterium]|nr:isoamylase early set domain-containing protein [Verrucomicrobiota bacterium]
MKAASSPTHKQTFSFKAPDAMSVLLVGDFTHWQQHPIPLKKKRGGIWQTTVALSPGSHHYRFLVDGQWRDDPECTLRTQNPFGTENSVRVVPRA